MSDYGNQRNSNSGSTEFPQTDWNAKDEPAKRPPEPWTPETLTEAGRIVLYDPQGTETQEERCLSAASVLDLEDMR